MSRRSDGSGWFPWKTSSLLLLVGITYLLQYDVTKHGSFEGKWSYDRRPISPTFYKQLFEGSRLEGCGFDPRPMLDETGVKAMPG